MSTGIRTAARLHCEAMGNQRHLYECYMQTLTYRPGVQWDARHVSEYIKRARQHFKRRGYVFRYAWVAELQMGRLKRFGEGARAVVHYHVLIWLPFGVDMPKADDHGWWPHGMTATEIVHAPVKYAVKYSSKGSSEGENLPKGCRVSGAGGLDHCEKRERRWWLAPRYIRDKSDISDDPIRAPGGGWLFRGTGAFHESAWVVVAIGRGHVRIIARESFEAKRNASVGVH